MLYHTNEGETTRREMPPVTAKTYRKGSGMGTENLKYHIIPLTYLHTTCKEKCFLLLKLNVHTVCF